VTSGGPRRARSRRRRATRALRDSSPLPECVGARRPGSAGARRLLEEAATASICSRPEHEWPGRCRASAGPGVGRRRIRSGLDPDDDLKVPRGGTSTSGLHAGAGTHRIYHQVGFNKVFGLSKSDSHRIVCRRLRGRQTLSGANGSYAGAPSVQPGVGRQERIRCAGEMVGRLAQPCSSIAGCNDSGLIARLDVWGSSPTWPPRIVRPRSARFT